MRNFRKVASWLQATVAAGALVLNDHFAAVFKRVDLEAYYLIGLIFATVVFMKLADEGADFIIDNSRTLRRLLAGSDDIEGDWVDVDMSLDKRGEVRFVEFCRIWYHEGSYIMSGDSWTPDGEWVYEFSSIGSNYQDRTLTYTYRAGLNSVGGYGVIRFFPLGSLPSEFICRYHDDISKTRHITRGRRMSMRRTLAAARERGVGGISSELVRRLLGRSFTPDKRRRLAMGFLEESQKERLLGAAALAQLDASGAEAGDAPQGRS